MTSLKEELKKIGPSECLDMADERAFDVLDEVDDKVKEKVLEDLKDFEFMQTSIQQELINIRMTSENKMILNSLNYINLYLENHKNMKYKIFGDFTKENNKENNK